MVDNIRNRVARVIAGSAHALLDKLEDSAPVAVLEQSVREVERITDDVRAELGQAVAHRHLAQQQHLRLNQEHDGLATALASALASARDDLAKPAIARQLDIEAQLPVLEVSLGNLAEQEAELAGYVDALMGKKREMESAIHDLEAARRVSDSAVVGRRLALSTAGAKVATAQAAFDRNYRRQTGLDATSRSATLEQAGKLRELSDMVRDNKINERLAALKAAQ